MLLSLIIELRNVMLFINEELRNIVIYLNEELRNIVWYIYLYIGISSIKSIYYRPI